MIVSTFMRLWSLGHGQTEVDCGIYQPLFNQSETGILVRGMTKHFAPRCFFNLTRHASIDTD